MIRKLKSGEFRIYSRHADPKTGKRKNLGTFASREKAEEHERANSVLQTALIRAKATENGYTICGTTRCGFGAVWAPKSLVSAFFAL